MNKIIDFLEDLSSNYDCDEDAHRYNTRCFVCEAQKLLNKTKVDGKPFISGKAIVSKGKPFISGEAIDFSVKNYVIKSDGKPFITENAKVSEGKPFISGKAMDFSVKNYVIKSEGANGTITFIVCATSKQEALDAILNDKEKAKYYCGSFLVENADIEELELYEGMIYCSEV